MKLKSPEFTKEELERLMSKINKKNFKKFTKALN